MIMSGHETNGKNNKGKDRTGEEDVGVDVGSAKSTTINLRKNNGLGNNDLFQILHPGQPYPSLDSRTPASLHDVRSGVPGAVEQEGSQ